jgi:hypothetical protein
LILLVFQLLPLAIYFFLLGTINRRRRPLIVPGTWDFVGVLVASSGFLLGFPCTLLSVLDDNWRAMFVYGEYPSSWAATSENLRSWWVLLMIVYFTVLVAVAGFLLWRARHLTSIYNIDLENVQTILGRIFQRLSLRPVRSGNMYYFDASRHSYPDAAAPKLEEQGIQTAPVESVTSLKVQTAPTPMVSMQNVVLEVDAFRLMWHVTLRWEPADSGLRQEIERELDRELAETSAPFHAMSGWLTLAGCGTVILMLALGIVLLIYRVVHRIL